MFTKCHSVPNASNKIIKWNKTSWAALMKRDPSMSYSCMWCTVCYCLWRGHSSNPIKKRWQQQAAWRFCLDLVEHSVNLVVMALWSLTISVSSCSTRWQHSSHNVEVRCSSRADFTWAPHTTTHNTVAAIKGVTVPVMRCWVFSVDCPDRRSQINHVFVEYPKPCCVVTDPCFE